MSEHEIDGRIYEFLTQRVRLDLRRDGPDFYR